MAKAKTEGADDPNKLIRAKAGTYRTADDRFEVRQAAPGWFLIDSGSTDELGQELTRGPFATLKVVGEQLPDARRTTMKSLPRPPRSAKKAAATPISKKAKKPPTRMTWLDKMSDAEATAARRLIRALSLEGIEDADRLVQAAGRTREPIIARRVLEHRLERMLDELPKAERETGRRLAARIAELLATGGTTLFDPLPGWVLVALDSGADSPEPRLIPKLPKR